MQQNLYNKVCDACSQQVTQRYSTSFSFGIRLLATQLHNPIYAIYGFVRVADEIVDTFHDHDQETLLKEFRRDTVDAVERRISTNPILHAFQQVVHQYQIDWETIDVFLKSMEMDLDEQSYDRTAFDQYIVGSAEVVGLMCLRVFTNGDAEAYAQLRPYAMRLGAAFQKVNFLRDIRDDYLELGRMYFPGVAFDQFSEKEKQRIEAEIIDDFSQAVIGIRKLPRGSRLGVYVAYLYYRSLFVKIQRTSAASILRARIRISNPRKIWLMCSGMLRHNTGLLS
jgi:phytoene/squalene synthetase